MTKEVKPQKKNSDGKYFFLGLGCLIAAIIIVIVCNATCKNNSTDSVSLCEYLNEVDPLAFVRHCTNEDVKASFAICVHALSCRDYTALTLQSMCENRCVNFSLGHPCGSNCADFWDTMSTYAGFFGKQ